MAGFEVVVRPVVFPDIRPAPARSLPPADDPTKGFCEITGAGNFPVQLSFSSQVSHVEIKAGGNRAPCRRCEGLSDGR